MSILSRSIAVLAVVAGAALSDPPPVRADSFGLVRADGGDRNRRDGDRHGSRRHERDSHDRDRHGPGSHDRGRHDRGRHDNGRHDNGRVGPPPWAYAYPPSWWDDPRPPVRYCRVVWSEWHRAYVQVCR